ncbi:hypothetical protein DJ010_20100 [Nocardioides silvaticus]|uniref:Uncharacterized protein n=1 Tax=Nocardioides silvaticus TaxID=2201891 RepID=A0A316TBP2_9ACTN|nr:hypothetical protein [Nocardioides silvaticus]PWN01148.1 hypothetical protein DJ010_20100 [Nocardioides silvaticus]
MDRIGRFVRGFGRFWYDFIVGDDPKIAIAVAVVLGLGAVLVGTAGATGVGVVAALAALLLVAFTVAMLVDVGASRRRG